MYIYNIYVYKYEQEQLKLRGISFRNSPSAFKT